MKPWADYLISAVSYTERGSSKYISKVAIHKDNGDTAGAAKIFSKDQVIAAMKKGVSFCTIRWDYEREKWAQGELVDYELVNGVEYLRSRPDAETKDNLQHLLPISNLQIG